jgi:ParB family chromosome partitioning protein
MSRQHHYLKTETEYFQAVERGEKKFELRKNDRDFKKYDMLILEETVKGVKTGRKLAPVEIQYVLKDCLKYGLCDGYCILNW